MTRVTLADVSWFLRVVEIPEHRWECRWGAQVFDQHATRAEALDHIRIVAVDHQPARIFVHELNHAVVEAVQNLPNPAA